MWYLDGIRVFGAVLTILGLVVIAPRAALEFVRSPVIAVSAIRRIWTAPKDALVSAPPARAEAYALSSEVKVTDDVTARMYSQEEWRIAKLELEVEDLKVILNSQQLSISALQDNAREAQDAQNRQIEAVSSRTAEIYQEVHDQRVEREVLDASGFPLAAIGALIAGVPGAFLVVRVVTSAGTVESPTWIWWACLVLGVGSIVWVVYRLVRNQSARR